jgi:hypothetical protein
MVTSPARVCSQHRHPPLAKSRQELGTPNLVFHMLRSRPPDRARARPGPPLTPLSYNRCD